MDGSTLQRELQKYQFQESNGAPYPKVGTSGEGCWHSREESRETSLKKQLEQINGDLCDLGLGQVDLLGKTSGGLAMTVETLRSLVVRVRTSQASNKQAKDQTDFFKRRNQKFEKVIHDLERKTGEAKSDKGKLEKNVIRLKQEVGQKVRESRRTIDKLTSQMETLRFKEKLIIEVMKGLQVELGAARKALSQAPLTKEPAQTNPLSVSPEIQSQIQEEYRLALWSTQQQKLNLKDALAEVIASFNSHLQAMQVPGTVQVEFSLDFQQMHSLFNKNLEAIMAITTRLEEQQLEIEQLHVTLQVSNRILRQLTVPESAANSGQFIHPVSIGDVEQLCSGDRTRAHRDQVNSFRVLVDCRKADLQRQEQLLLMQSNRRKEFLDRVNTVAAQCAALVEATVTPYVCSEQHQQTVGVI